MKSSETDFGYALTNFLTKHLFGRRNLSKNTIKSYRDTFKLMLIYFENEKAKHPSRLTLKEFTRDMVIGYLDWLENGRGLSPRSINQRLAAIQSFCRYLHTEFPDYINEYQKIISIPYKKYNRPIIEYLTKDELDYILSVPDTTTWQGKRDIVILCTLYDTGARVQELCDINISDIHLTDNPYIQLIGKGNKTRYVPIMRKTAKLLSKYVKEFHRCSQMTDAQPLFYTRNHTRFTRASIAHLITKYSAIARERGYLIPDNITPHTFRHTKAMHLCQAGIDMIYIRDILGHKRLSTTEIYAKINVENMRDSLERAYPELSEHGFDEWNNDDSLMQFLISL